MSPGVLFVWKVSCFYEKVHDFANFGGCAAILIWDQLAKTRLNLMDKHSTHLSFSLKEKNWYVMAHCNN